MMINKIVQSVKQVFAPEKKPRPPVEYHDQKPWTIRHSSLDVQPWQDDGWLSAGGRYNFRGWFNR
jgi:hypothetical protein